MAVILGNSVTHKIGIFMEFPVFTTPPVGSFEKEGMNCFSLDLYLIPPAEIRLN